MYGIGNIENKLRLTTSINGLGLVPPMKSKAASIGLGKPTIKFEFDTNSELADFLSNKKQSYQYAENVTVNSNNSKSKSTAQNKITSSSFRQLPLSSDNPQLPPSGSPKTLPGSANPKSLPPASQYIPPLTSVLKPDGVYINHRKIGDYGYINANLKYINFYIDKEYMVNDNIFKWSERIFPHAVIIICFQDSNGIWKFFFQRPKYKDFIYKKFPNSFIQNSGIKYFIFDLHHIEKVIQAFESEGYPVVLVYRNIVENINDIPQPSSPKALPPATSNPVPTTPQLTSKDWEDAAKLKALLEPTTPKDTSPDWAAICKRLVESHHWNSFDPESAAEYDVKIFRNAYNNVIAELPENRKADFTQKFIAKVYEIARLNAAAPSAAVTGQGSITAKKAAKYNAANDRYMQARADFSEWLNNYAERAAKIEDRERTSDER